MTGAVDYPVELTPPDIEPYRFGNTGIPYYTRFDSGVPGPHVMINALIHGNELCGAIALDRLFRLGVRPVRGRLTLGFANAQAYRRFDPADPLRARYVDQDLNRVWDTALLDGPQRSAELSRARQLRPLIDSVDLLLDIHSMQHPNPPLMLSGRWTKGLELARGIGHPAHIVRDGGHASGRRLIDYGRFDQPEARQTALLIECGQHWARPSATVAIENALRFLLHAGTIDRVPEGILPATPPPPQTVIEVTEAVTITSDDFRFAEDFIGMEVLPHAGMPIGQDGDRPIVAPYDGCVLIMPSRPVHRGQTAVRLGRIVPATDAVPALQH